ncbi:MAG: GNAT family N-acetyltransferase [Myxococcales bacterium]|nr:GNAT family N-acetyltransferase [Myxococcales bacterium]USN50576.1 MAG: GNAT family N-acetyltransferase [Myxococcales bacterium]
MAHFVLKNQQSVTIRSIIRDDALERHKFFCKLSLAQIGMLHSIDEIDEDPQESLEHIDDFISNKRGLWLIALDQEHKIIGEIDITIKSFRRVRHIGSLTMGVCPSIQGQGLGSLLMQEALRWAKAQGLSRVELSVFASNIKAQNLYKKHGFTQEGLRKNYLNHGDNQFEDDILLARLI